MGVMVSRQENSFVKALMMQEPTAIGRRVKSPEMAEITLAPQRAGMLEQNASHGVHRHTRKGTC